jgi:hypothetical protein
LSDLFDTIDFYICYFWLIENFQVSVSIPDFGHDYITTTLILDFHVTFRTEEEYVKSVDEKMLALMGPRVPGCGKLGREKFCMVACGHVHTLGLTVGGRVYAWGDNTRGQLGVQSSLGGERKNRSAQDVVRREASASAQSRVRSFYFYYL